MGLLACVVFTLLVQFYEGKPLQFKGYPEENRNVKNPFSALLFEGDMLVEPRLKKIALNGGDISMATTGRKRGATTSNLWPNGVIPYKISSSLSAHQNLIESAMADWESGTCLSFVPADGTENVFLRITNEFAGCFAHIGCRDVSRVPAEYLPVGLWLNLGPGCYQRRVVLHELGHAIGFYHEQSRPDRDSYVQVNLTNIMTGREIEFSKYTNGKIDSLGSPYDLKSVMHYGPKTFSKNNQNTIVPVDSNKVLTLNENISDTDRDQVNLLYNCD